MLNQTAGSVFRWKHWLLGSKAAWTSTALAKKAMEIKKALGTGRCGWRCHLIKSRRACIFYRIPIFSCEQLFLSGLLPTVVSDPHLRILGEAVGDGLQKGLILRTSAIECGKCGGTSRWICREFNLHPYTMKGGRFFIAGMDRYYGCNLVVYLFMDSF